MPVLVPKSIVVHIVVHTITVLSLLLRQTVPSPRGMLGQLVHALGVYEQLSSLPSLVPLLRVATPPLQSPSSLHLSQSSDAKIDVWKSSLAWQVPPCPLPSPS